MTDEQRSDAIYEALAPLRHFHDEYDEGMEFMKYHEQTELNLMKVLDKVFSEGYAEGSQDVYDHLWKPNE